MTTERVIPSQTSVEYRYTDGRHQYGYSARNRLIQVDAGDTATYAYNALGQRVYKNAVTVPTQIGANKKITRYVYDGARLLGEYLGDGAPVQEIVWLGDTPVAVLQGNQVYYVHTDSLGAPRALTDAQARVVWRWDPRPFGDSAPNEDPDGDGQKVVLNLRFPGQYYDQETGLHYNYYRYYDPSSGRYITSDPIGLNGGLNTYGYVGGSPLRWRDLAGLRPKPCDYDPEIICDDGAGNIDAAPVCMDDNCLIYNGTDPRNRGVSNPDIGLVSRDSVRIFLGRVSTESAIASTVCAIKGWGPQAITLGFMSTVASAGEQLLDPNPAKAFREASIDIMTARLRFTGLIINTALKELTNRLSK